MLSCKNGALAPQGGTNGKKRLVDVMGPRVRGVWRRVEPLLELTHAQDEAAPKEEQLQYAEAYLKGEQRHLDWYIGELPQHVQEKQQWEEYIVVQQECVAEAEKRVTRAKAAYEPVRALAARLARRTDVVNGLAWLKSPGGSSGLNGSLGGSSSQGGGVDSSGGLWLGGWYKRPRDPAAAAAAAREPSSEPASLTTTVFLGEGSVVELAAEVLSYLRVKEAVHALGSASKGLRAAVLADIETLHLVCRDWRDERQMPLPFYLVGFPLQQCERLRHLLLLEAPAHWPGLTEAISTQLQTYYITSGMAVSPRAFASLPWPALVRIEVDCRYRDFFAGLDALPAPPVFPALRTIGLSFVNEEVARPFLSLLAKGCFPAFQRFVWPSLREAGSRRRSTTTSSRTDNVMFSGCRNPSMMEGRYWNVLRRCVRGGMDQLLLGCPSREPGAFHITGLSSLVTDRTLVHLRELRLTDAVHAGFGDVAQLLAAIGSSSNQPPMPCLEHLDLDWMLRDDFAQREEALGYFTLSRASLPALRRLRLRARVTPQGLRALLLAAGGGLTQLSLDQPAMGGPFLALMAGTSGPFAPAWLTSLRELAFHVAERQGTVNTPTQALAAVLQQLPALTSLRMGLPSLDKFVVRFLNAWENGDGLHGLKHLDLSGPEGTRRPGLEADDHPLKPHVSHGAILLLLGWLRQAQSSSSSAAAAAKGLEIVLPRKSARPCFRELVEEHLPGTKLAFGRQ